TGGGGMVFLSTQFRPVAEAGRFRDFLHRTVTGAVSYVTIEEGPFASQVAGQVGAGRTQMGLLGGAHGDLAPLAGKYLEDLSGVLLHRFLEGYLLPSFTGGQMTTFRSKEAVTAWQYLRELWPNCGQASTNYNFMQEPLASGEVSVGWDHVARLTDVTKRTGTW